MVVVEGMSQRPSRSTLIAPKSNLADLGLERDFLRRLKELFTQNPDQLPVLCQFFTCQGPIHHQSALKANKTNKRERARDRESEEYINRNKTNTFKMDRVDEMRQHWSLGLEAMLAGRDLVSWCLEKPEDIKPNPLLRSAVLGQYSQPHDTRAMISHITGGRLITPDTITARAAHPDGGVSLEQILMWKLVYCDAAIVTDEQDLSRLYLARLRDEELQPPEERARELVRTDDEKTARRNAKWMIPAIEKIAPEELPQSHRVLDCRRKMLPIWGNVSPPPPQWIRTIVNIQQPWGFVYYKTAEVQQEYGHKWEDTWEFVSENMSMTSFYERRGLSHIELDSIHCGGHLFTLADLETQEWLEDEVVENPEDDEGSRA